MVPQAKSAVITSVTAFVLLFVCAYFMNPLELILEQHRSSEVPRSSSSAGVWVGSEFRPKRVWFRDNVDTIHSPADQAAKEAALVALHAKDAISRTKVVAKKSEGSIHFFSAPELDLSNGLKSHATRDSQLQSDFAGSSGADKLSQRFRPHSLSSHFDLTPVFKDSDVLLPPEYRGESPASLAKAAALLAKQASIVADKSQDHVKSNSQFNNYMVFKPSANVEVSHVDADDKHLDMSEGERKGGDEELESIERRLKSLESEVSNLRVSLSNSKDLSPNNEIAESETLPSSSASEVQDSAVSGGYDTTEEQALPDDTPNASGGKDTLDASDIQAMQEKFRESGSQNPEADAAIEKVLNDLNKASSASQSDLAHP